MRKLLIVMLFSVFAGGTAMAKGGQTATFAPIADAKWTIPMGEGGPQVAVLWGDLNKNGDLGFLLKLPAGFTSPMHIHTNAYQAVQVQGVSAHWLEGQSEADAKPLPPGSYWSMPGKLKHVSQCKPGIDCVVLVTIHGKFDFIPAEKPTKGPDAIKLPAK